MALVLKTLDSVTGYIGEPLFYIWASHASYITLKITLQTARSSLKSWLFKTSKQKSSSNVLFFPDRKQTCPAFLRKKKCANEECLYGHAETSLWKLINTLDMAKSTIEVCVFVITSQDLADIIIKKHCEGIVVRVVTDCEKMNLNCSQIEQMRSKGIQVRHDKTSYFMHHKFAIVDNQVLVNGSFNWTKQAITGNQENVIISNDEELISPYQQQFQKLWEMYKPIDQF